VRKIVVYIDILSRGAISVISGVWFVVYRCEFSEDPHWHLPPTPKEKNILDLFA
jgi:hypothetical protein